jgi:RNA polymerase sigma-70 factor (ECF subfamily)
MITATVIPFPVAEGPGRSTERVSEKPHAAVRPEAAPAAGAEAAELSALLVRIQRRDQAALGELHDRTMGRVLALAQRIVRVRADAEEVAIDTFVQAWEAAAAFDTRRGGVMAWLLTICRSRALDLLRRRSARAAAEGGFAAEPADELAAAPDDLLALAQGGSLLAAALRELSPERRQVLGLAYLRGYTQEEIAAFTGIAVGTVKSHMRRALGELREQLVIDSAGTHGSEGQ